jgi:hypothetical protein
MKIQYTDIINIKSLKPGVDGANYSSSLVIQYGRNYSEDNCAEYTIHEDSDIIISMRGVSKIKTVETLLKNENDARIRYEREIAYSKNISHVVSGINLRPPLANPEKFYALRIYDIVAIDFGDLIKSKTGFWIVTDREIDIETNITVIAVKEKVV